MLDPPRPTANGADLLTHGPAYDPYGPGADWGGRRRLPPAPRRHRRRAKPSRPRWLRIVGWVGAFLGILLVAGGGFAAYQYKKLSGNIHREDALATDDKSIRDAAKQLDAENYLLLGSDTRAGANGRYEASPGQVSGERSDTTILAHLSPRRDKATMISFPRDSWVRLPTCRKKDGTVVPEHDGQFNEAFATGGAQCTVLAVQKLTGIRINHYVQVDFTGFKSMVDAVGGVPICTTTRLRDAESGLRLDPGTTNLRGEQALAYVRARYGIGDGSDLGRIQRQQRFLGAMVRKATSAKLLVNPVALTRFLNAATKSLTLDRHTSLGDLKKLADQLRDLDPKRVSFLTAPIANPAYNPPGFPPPPPGRGGSKVLLDQVAGRKLWDSIINDKPAPPKTATPATRYAEADRAHGRAGGRDREGAQRGRAGRAGPQGQRRDGERRLPYRRPDERGQGRDHHGPVRAVPGRPRPARSRRRCPARCCSPRTTSAPRSSWSSGRTTPAWSRSRWATRPPRRPSRRRSRPRPARRRSRPRASTPPTPPAPDPRPGQPRRVKRLRTSVRTAMRAGTVTSSAVGKTPAVLQSSSRSRSNQSSSGSSSGPS